MKKIILFFVIIVGILSSFKKVNAQYWNTFRTNYGYINLGPANSSWAHIYTDRPKFIFNKDIYTYGGGFSSYS